LNKLVIPTILIATVLIAGIFAFSPIEKASTVHAGLTGIQVVEDSGTGITEDDRVRVVFDCDKDFAITEIYFTLTNLDTDGGTETLDIGDDSADLSPVEIDGVPLSDEFGDVEEESFLQSTGNPDVVPTVVWTGFALDEDEEDTPLILFAKGEGTDDIVLNFFDDGENPLDGDEVFTVKALITSGSNAVCTVDVDVVP